MWRPQLNIFFCILPSNRKHYFLHLHDLSDLEPHHPLSSCLLSWDTKCSICPKIVQFVFFEDPKTSHAIPIISAIKTLTIHQHRSHITINAYTSQAKTRTHLSCSPCHCYSHTGTGIHIIYKNSTQLVCYNIWRTLDISHPYRRVSNEVSVTPPRRVRVCFSTVVEMAYPP